jgi:hypothetical protein
LLETANPVTTATKNEKAKRTKSMCRDGFVPTYNSTKVGFDKPN